MEGTPVILFWLQSLSNLVSKVRLKSLFDFFAERLAGFKLDNF
jgi:hypothetical protein